MLGRIVYVLIVGAIVIGGALALHFLAEEPGQIIIDYGDRTRPISLIEAALGLVAFLVLALAAIILGRFLIALVRFISGDADALGGFWTRRRQRSGLDALSKGMIALASGDAKTAAKKAKIAEQKLMQPGLTRLLNAQAAVMAGNEGRAETYFKALMAEPETAFVGTQGLLTQAIESQDEDRALKLALHAKELKPKDEGTLDTLYMLQSRKFDWTGARATLTDQRKAGHVGKLEAAKRESALALAQAEDADSLGEEEHARALAVEAAKLDPTNVEAVATAVRHLVASGSRRAATKLVTDGWRARPHPILAAAYASIEPDESPSERRRRFEALFNLQPTHDETRFLRAELALVAEDWKAARNSIQDLRETEPSARSCAIMAAIARGEGEPDHVIRGWLARALGAPRNDATDSEISHAAMLPLLVETVGESKSDATDVPPGQETPEAMSETPAAEAESDVQDAETDGLADGTNPKSEAAA